MLTGTNLLYTKQFNIRIVAEVVRLFGPLARADIARRTALSGQTVSNLVKELLELGVLHEVERRHEGGRGAPAAMLAVNPDCAFAVGIDFNRDHLTGVLVDLAGTVRGRLAVEIELPAPADAVERMADMVETLVREQGIDRGSVCGVGIGIPGPMYQDLEGDGGYVVNPRSFPGWHRVPLATMLRARLGLPVLLENNATAAAVGERWYGAGRQIDSFFYLFFGSGLGGAVVINGRPYEGFTGNAGEIGYLPPVIGGSGVGEVEDGAHVGLHFSLPRLYETLRAGGAEARTPDDLDRLLAEGDPRLLAWLDVAADQLTGLVLAVEYLIDPEAIVYGGRLSDRILQRLIDRVALQLPRRRITEKVAVPQQLLATAGADAAALGVATLPIYEVFAPAPQVLLKRRRRRAESGLQMSGMSGMAGAI